jgi:hypothetical protein
LAGIFTAANKMLVKKPDDFLKVTFDNKLIGNWKVLSELTVSYTVHDTSWKFSDRLQKNGSFLAAVLSP